MLGTKIFKDQNILGSFWDAKQTYLAFEKEKGLFVKHSVPLICDQSHMKFNVR